MLTWQWTNSMSFVSSSFPTVLDIMIVEIRRRAGQLIYHSYRLRRTVPKEHGFAPRHRPGHDDDRTWPNGQLICNEYRWESTVCECGTISRCRGAYLAAGRWYTDGTIVVTGRIHFIVDTEIQEPCLLPFCSRRYYLIWGVMFAKYTTATCHNIVQKVLFHSGFEKIPALLRWIRIAHMLLYLWARRCHTTMFRGRIFEDYERDLHEVFYENFLITCHPDTNACAANTGIGTNRYWNMLQIFTYRICTLTIIECLWLFKPRSTNESNNSIIFIQIVNCLYTNRDDCADDCKATHLATLE